MRVRFPVLVVAALLKAAALAAVVWPPSAVHTKPERIGPHLYTITFDRYDYGYATVYLTRIENAMREAAAARAGGGCSACRRGRFVGRNFDWTYDDTDEFVISVPAVPGERHASIGVTSATRFAPGQPLPNGANAAEYEMVPFFTMDGINDAGVFCECNLMPVSDEPNDRGTRLDDPTARQLSESSVVRFVLDYADSARHAVEMLRKASIRNLPNAPISWMVADEKDTFVFEVVGNALNVIEGERAKTLTNFYLSKSPVCGRPYAPGSGGIERYERLSRVPETVGSLQAMLDVMKGEFYSQMYKPGNELRWWSEMNDAEYEDEKGETKMFSAADGKDPSTWVFQRRMKEFADDRAAFARCQEYEKRIGSRQGTDLWHTIHSAAYDMKERTLALRVQEQDKVYTFRLKPPQQGGGVGRP